MNIQTKFNIDDSVFFLYKNKVVEQKVLSISIACDPTPTIQYQLYIDSCNNWFPEETLFASKEELLKSL